MTHFILDASVALAILMDEKSVYAESVALRLENDAIAHVPYLWQLEIRNVMLIKNIGETLGIKIF